jgi:beta-aspartyl-peptidase (threonine type)
MTRQFSLFLILLVVSFISCENQNQKSSATRPEYVLVIHGGAGTILKENMTTEKEKAYLEKLEDVLRSGQKILENGGTSLDAITTVITLMEDSPLFNAGKGAVFTEEGIVEMDASIMDGKTGLAGAVAGVHNIKNPILAAKEVMTNSKHVMLTGDGADKFADERGLVMVDSSYFFTERRWKSYQNAKDKKHGTVGAVALDKYGNLTAGTSTGGMTYKMKGRVGDSPIIGAGTFADNNTCAVSATGHGEYFIRNVVAYDISALMKYKNMKLSDAADEVILNKLVDIGGDGGIIAVDKNGNYTMVFNTAGMYRGVITSEGKFEVEIYKIK